ncbi:MAG: hypothetical protein BWK80_00640 [Desulfobacteraceae bacterium IS3]|nr:MAG: hypothetical protein BWK80_00640 [Desulfobacteraceae bacterium IS3]
MRRSAKNPFLHIFSRFQAPAFLVPKPHRSRSQAPAWEREKRIRKECKNSFFAKTFKRAFFQILLTSLLFNIIFKIHTIISGVCNLNFSQSAD